MSHTVTVEEANRAFPAILQQVLKGEEVIIERGGIAVARITPEVHRTPLRRFGRARGQVRMAEDFDAPLEDFREYMG